MIRFATALAASVFSISVAAAQPAPSLNWNGTYGGIVAGFARGDSTHCDQGNPCPATSAQHDVAGAFGGFTLGHNVQRGLWVYGIEADIAAANIDNSSPSTLSLFNCGTVDCITKINTFGTARGRLGYSFGRFLPYVTAGVGVADIQGKLPAAITANGSRMKASFVYGLGVETMIAPNWSMKFEWLRTDDFGSFQYDSQGSCGPVGSRCYITNVSLDLLRIGLNYRFGN